MRKAFRLLGLPGENVRVIEVDEDRRIRRDYLCRQIEADMEAGYTPVVICASAGTANTGAIDALEQMAELCLEYGIWYHIDGSYGAPAVITDSYAWMKDAFSRADSLSLDPHKWLFVPADTGCILIRDEKASYRTFSLSSEYTSITQTDPIEQYALFDHGLELSRRFRGLKVWTILRTRGLAKIRQAIDHDISLSRYLNERIEQEPKLQSFGSELSITCFRYIPDGKVEVVRINAVNRQIIETIIAEGHCYMSPTELDGRYSLRACIVNFRTTAEDIDFLVDEVIRIGDGIPSK